MAHITLISGGGRSGKSRYAQTLAETAPGARTFIATCPIIDAETEDRVRRHQADRAHRGWNTIEEPIDLPAALARTDAGTVLIDCLTLWINNLMYHAEQRRTPIDENTIAAHAAELLAACRARAGAVILVTNEVGLGIIPENPLARKYRDLVGRCNQIIAAGANVVTLVVCGIPLTIKKENQ